MDTEVIAALGRLAGAGVEKTAAGLINPNTMRSGANWLRSAVGPAAKKTIGYGAAGLAGTAAVGAAGTGAAYGAGRAMNQNPLTQYVDSSNQYNRMRENYEGQIKALKDDPNGGQRSWYDPARITDSVFGMDAGAQARRKQQQLAEMQRNLQSGNYGGTLGYGNAGAYKVEADRAADAIKNQRFRTGGVFSHWQSEADFNAALDQALKDNQGLADPRLGRAAQAGQAAGQAYGATPPGPRPVGLSYDYARDPAGDVRGRDWSQVRQS